MPAQIGMAVIGAGIMGKLHARVYNQLPQCRLVAVADLNGERARSLAAELGGVDWYEDYAAMLADERIQAVSVATPDHLHRQPVIDCLQAGRHVLVEKPLATSLADCDAMMAAERATGKRLMVNYTHRWAPPYAVAKQRLTQGAMGQPVMAYARKNDTIYVPTEMCPWLAQSSSADFLSSHDIDLVRWYFGLEAESVYARGVKRVLKARGIDIYDAIQALVTFRGGAIATFESSWIYPNTFPTATDSFIELVMEAGVIHLDRKQEIVDACDAGAYTFPKVSINYEIDGRIEGAFRCCLEHFARCIQEDRPPLVSSTDGRKVAEIVTAIHLSLESGGIVPLPL